MTTHLVARRCGPRTAARMLVDMHRRLEQWERFRREIPANDPEAEDARRTADAQIQFIRRMVGPDGGER